MSEFIDGEEQLNATRIRGKRISTTAPTNGQVMTYDSAAGLWKPATPAAGATLPTLYYAANRWVIPGWGWSGNVSDTLVSGRLYYLPIFIGAQTSYDQIGINVTTLQAGALLRMGCYAWLGGQPGALVFDAGTVSGETTGAKQIEISQTLAAGLYFLTLVCDTADVGIRVLATAALTVAPISPFATAPGNQASGALLVTTGQAAVVAGGLPDLAPTPNSYGSAPLIGVHLHEVN